ncbi:MAG: pseudouridine synthase [Victivallaceae bacterium]|nr:pseudouridine synthase [Victivallaceae bacterium]
MQNAGKTSLAKYLGSCGIASRRKSAELIRCGAVQVNGAVIREPGFKISSRDEVVYAGEPVICRPKVYLMLNKPRGYVCTNDDPHALRKAVDLIELPPGQSGIRLFSAGRLDRDSEGLLIFTNDGDYAEKIMHPRHEIIKTYRVETVAEISDGKLSELRAGIIDDHEFLRPEKIVREGKRQYLFILNEGKKREIRRLVRFAGTEVKTLQRIALGALELGTLNCGQWRYLSAEDLAQSLSRTANDLRREKCCPLHKRPFSCQ